MTRDTLDTPNERIPDPAMTETKTMSYGRARVTFRAGTHLRHPFNSYAQPIPFKNGTVC